MAAEREDAKKMAKSTEEPGPQYRTSGSVRKRYDDLSTRQFRRWLKEGVIPPPDLTIAGRDYWLDETLDKNDRRHAAEAAKRVQASHFTPRSERAMAE
jgi:hypothetical protein